MPHLQPVQSLLLNSGVTSQLKSIPFWHETLIISGALSVLKCWKLPIKRLRSSKKKAASQSNQAAVFHLVMQRVTPLRAELQRRFWTTYWAAPHVWADEIPSAESTREGRCTRTKGPSNKQPVLALPRANGLLNIVTNVYDTQPGCALLQNSKTEWCDQ